MKQIYSFLIILLGFAFFSLATYGQNKALAIGDSVPDIAFPYSYNYKTGKKAPFKISDYRGKMIIFDFWNPWCTSCVKGFPHLDSMQNTYNNQIQVVTVTLDKEEKIAKYFKTFKNIHCPNLPGITGDTILHHLFPHTGVPFQVWIGKDGKVLQLVNDFTFTGKNLEAVMANQQAQLRQAKKNVYVSTTIDDRWKNEVEFSSILIREKWSNALHIDGRENRKGYTEAGSKAQLYQRAYQGLTENKYELLRAGRLVLEVKDKGQYLNPYRGEESVQWMAKNLYHYEICVPDSYNGNYFELMKQDLDRYFSLKTKIEKREVQCLTLVRTSGKDKLKTTGNASFDDFRAASTKSYIGSQERRLINQPLASLIDKLRAYIEVQFDTPFWDATGYIGNIDISFPATALDEASVPAFRKALEKYDLDLVMKPHLIEVLVISDK